MRFGASHDIMLTVIASLLGVLILLILLHLSARYLLIRQMRRQAALYSQRTDQIAPIEIESSINEPSKSGLDPLVIASLSMFTYEVTTGEVNDDDDEATECSICLGTITEDTTVRLLPNCKHMFHVDYIDKWLGSHTTCPICRTVAEPMVQPEDKELSSMVQPMAPLMEENASLSAAQVEKEGGPSGSGSGSRFGSFRRILGGDRKRSSSRIQSCGDEVGTQDIEMR